MPEIPDIELYLNCLRMRIVGSRLLKLRLLNPFVLRSVSPKPAELEGKVVAEVFRLGKRVVIGLEGDHFIVIHLMIAGRFRWNDKPVKGAGKIGHAIFEFEPQGSLILTEASSKKRASIHLVDGRTGLAPHTPTGIDPMAHKSGEFEAALRAENRTLKRALTNQHRIAGIGNAYSDEILFDARLSPLRPTSSLSDEEVRRLDISMRATLAAETAALQVQFLEKFPGPGDVTAFRPDFAVHGKFGQPCPVCGKKIQRIRYAENETNYCAQCQNEGRLLADRSLSRLLKEDWPRTMEELEG